jgi:hypothetical protein
MISRPKGRALGFEWVATRGEAAAFVTLIGYLTRARLFRVIRTRGTLSATPSGSKDHLY